jgi:seryl-tRNA synthetase
MLELQFLREHRDEAEKRLAKRNIDVQGLLDTARSLDDTRRSTQTELDARLAELNGLSRTIGELMKAGKKDEADTAKARTTDLKASTQELKEKLESTEKALHDHLCTIPNAPNAKVPMGRPRKRTPWCCRKAISQPCTPVPNHTGNWARNMVSCTWIWA